VARGRVCADGFNSVGLVKHEKLPAKCAKIGSETACAVWVHFEAVAVLKLRIVT